MNKIEFHSVTFVVLNDILDMIEDEGERDTLSETISNMVSYGDAEMTMISWSMFLKFAEQVNVSIPECFKSVNMSETYIALEG